jgi:hypothetical protein
MPIAKDIRHGDRYFYRGGGQKAGDCGDLIFRVLTAPNYSQLMARTIAKAGDIPHPG